MEIPDTEGEMKPRQMPSRDWAREWEPETFRSPFALQLQLQLFFLLGLKTDMPN